MDFGGAEGGVLIETQQTLLLCLNFVKYSGSYLFLGVEVAMRAAE